jgi:putative ABC transport system ATP-binding protein
MGEKMSFLKVNHVEKIYQQKLGGQKTIALKDIDFEMSTGEFVTIMGESGAGKSTLLNILATLETPTTGKITLNETDFSRMNENQLSNFRREHLGFVFQDFNLIETFNAKDNILLPLVLRKESKQVMLTRLENLSKTLEISDLLEKFPYELSGGQKQRIAVARALITKPEIILADEPTAALDSKNAKVLMKLFQKVNETGQSILMVSHSVFAASESSRVLFIKDGKIYHQLYRGNYTAAEFLVEINQVMSSLYGGDHE